MSCTCGRYLCNPINAGARGSEPLCCCSWWPEICSGVLGLFPFLTLPVSACLCWFMPCPCWWQAQQACGEMVEDLCPSHKWFPPLTSLLTRSFCLFLPYCNSRTLLLLLFTAYITEKLSLPLCRAFYIFENSSFFLSQLFSEQKNLNILHLSTQSIFSLSSLISWYIICESRADILQAINETNNIKVKALIWPQAQPCCTCELCSFCPGCWQYFGITLSAL